MSREDDKRADEPAPESEGTSVSEGEGKSEGEGEGEGESEGVSEGVSESESESVSEGVSEGEGDSGREGTLAIGKPGLDADGNPVPDFSKEPIPRVPRRGNYRWALRDIVRIVFLAGLLAMVIVARKPCSNAVANFVDSFDEEADEPKAGGIRENDNGELIGPDGKKLERLTPEKLEELKSKQEAERARKKASETVAPDSGSSE